MERSNWCYGSRVGRRREARTCTSLSGLALLVHACPVPTCKASTNACVGTTMFVCVRTMPMCMASSRTCVVAFICTLKRKCMLPRRCNVRVDRSYVGVAVRWATMRCMSSVMNRCADKSWRRSSLLKVSVNTISATDMGDMFRTRRMTPATITICVTPMMAAMFDAGGVAAPGRVICVTPPGELVMRLRLRRQRSVARRQLMQ